MVGTPVTFTIQIEQAEMRTTDNRVSTVLELYGSGLSARYGPGEVKAIVRILFQERLGWDAAELEMNRTTSLSESELLKVYDPLSRLIAGEPLQYVLGHVHFCGLDLVVGPGVLIPRPETEELVMRIVAEEAVPRSIIDIGTGSGCIALALKKVFPDARVVGLDVSEEALTYARRNAKDTGLDVQWLHADVLEAAFQFPEGVDLVVSNPPYVLRNEEGSMSEHVIRHEPPIALFVKDMDPLYFYKLIARKALTSLPKDGRIRFEGHYVHAPEVGRMLEEMGYRNVAVDKDLSGHHRFIGADR